jgi:hypothetical protein
MYACMTGQPPQQADQRELDDKVPAVLADWRTATSGTCSTRWLGAFGSIRWSGPRVCSRCSGRFAAGGNPRQRGRSRPRRPRVGWGTGSMSVSARFMRRREPDTLTQLG